MLYYAAGSRKTFKRGRDFMKQKKLLALITSLAITASAFTGLVIPANAADGDNLLTDGGFETAALKTDDDWKVSAKEVWCSFANTGGSVAVSEEDKSEGAKSAKVAQGGIAQRVTLEADKTYELSAMLKGTGSVNMKIYDGTAEWPIGDTNKVAEKAVTLTDAWTESTVVIENAKAQDYVVYIENYNNAGASCYVDGVKLAVKAAEVIDSPTSYFSFDDTNLGTVVIPDTTAKTLTDAPDAAVTVADGYKGKAASFTGAGSNGIKLGNVITNAAYSIGFMMKANAIKQYTPALFINSGDASSESWLNAPVGWKEDKTAMIWSKGADAYGDIVSAASANLKENEWQSIIISADGAGKASLYVDGAKTAAGDVKNTVGEATNTYLGVNYWDTPFNGLIDEVYIYNGTALSDEEAAALNEKMNPSAEATEEPKVTADPSAPASPVWQQGKGAVGDPDLNHEFAPYQGKDNVLKVTDKNVFALMNNVSEGVVNFNTNIYLTSDRNFRILLDSSAEVVYSASTVIAQAAVNDTDGNVYVGPGTDNSGSGTILFTPASSGAWYNIDITMDYSKKDTNEFITITAKADGSDEVLGTEKIGANTGVDTTLKAIRLMATATSSYFEGMKVTPASALASAEPSATATPAPTENPAATGAPAVDPTALIDFTNRTLTADTKGNSTVFAVGTADAGPNGLTAPGFAAAEAGDVLYIGSSQSGASKNLGYTAPFATDTDGVVQYRGLVNVSFKIEPMQVRNDKEASVVCQLADIYKTGILPITVGTGMESYLTIDGDKVTTEYGKYYTVEETLDFNNMTAAVTIKDAAGTAIHTKEGIALAAENLSYLYFADTDWNYGYFALDDIQLSAEAIGAPKYYTYTLNTTRFAKMTTSEGKVYCADVNGKLVVELLEPGATFDYTLSKVGYTDVTGKVDNIQSDITEDKPMTLADDSVIFIESEFGNENDAYVSPDGNRNDSISIGEVALPTMSEIKADFNFAGFGSNSGQQKTWCLLSNGNQKFVGIQICDDGLFAWTGWTGSSNMNQSSDIGAFTNGVRLGDVPSGEFSVKFVINTEDKAITAGYGDATGSLPFDIEVESIVGMATGLYRYNGALKTTEIKITEPDVNYMVVIGDTDFAKVKGTAITREYGKSEAVITKDETFTWTAARTDAPVEVTKTGAKMTLAEAPAADTTAVALKASYNADGTLAGVTAEDVSLTAGQTEVELEAQAGEKLMLWDSLAGMKPLAAAAEAAEYTAIVPGVTDMTGISLDSETGVLTVEDTAVPGPLTITCTGSTGKTASLDIMIEDFADVTATVDGPNAYEVGQTGTYKVTSLVDEYRANVIDLFAPAYASDNADVVKVDPVTGVAEAVGAGSANIIVTVGNEGQKAEIKIPVTVAAYYVTADATGDSTEVSLAGIKKLDETTGYQVTTATADGVQVAKTVVPVAEVSGDKLTVDTTGAAKVEVAPVYECKMNTKYIVPSATYNVTATVNNGRRTDLYVNDQMLINNINQGSDNWTVGRTIAASTDYTAEDVVISQGYANFNYQDDQSGASTITGIKFVKAPSIVTRARRIYVLGDSLVAKYYGDAPEGQEALVRTGWGDALPNYIVDDVKVTNLANSGVTAIGLYTSAFSNVLESAQAGDIMVLESGYNDYSYSSIAEMKTVMTAMVEKAYAKGVTTFIVPPNAGSHGTAQTKDVRYASSIRELAEELGEKTTLIDLSELSYNFLTSRYTVDGQMDWDIVTTYYNNTGDKLHSSYNAANCWAAIIANGLYKNDATKDVVNTEFTYTFNDSKEDISVNALTIVPDAAE